VLHVVLVLLVARARLLSGVDVTGAGVWGTAEVSKAGKAGTNVWGTAKAAGVASSSCSEAMSSSREATAMFRDSTCTQA
jgi:hypothetical protein